MGKVENVQVDNDGPPVFDAQYGFPKGRKLKESKVTALEMETAHLRLDQRDYCAHKLIDVQVCFRKNFPLVWKCKEAKHAYDSCYYEQEVMRCKEFERERRLLDKEKAKALREAALE